ncbi:uncharacterized protein ASCRUDRAFT_70796 [Ascoidea rubescens DSM 1968]|uniref:Rho-GAP domain-containing protein n=1 Tax=Ascoidea rubescens DSM 1968 TaxID=1344418 RepID=A0A1D2VEY7_9ASCO|nr:hypothetical protein ASCRUDRAFT_70796 [Ascoidea rubescens DSM 1968]ODV60258.1 hypothetical protein ASCRUDRAFT_70796 [Ascoidea rubescens DSM 1968]
MSSPDPSLFGLALDKVPRADYLLKFLKANHTQAIRIVLNLPIIVISIIEYLILNNFFLKPAIFRKSGNSRSITILQKYFNTFYQDLLKQNIDLNHIDPSILKSVSINSINDHQIKLQKDLIQHNAIIRSNTAAQNSNKSVNIEALKNKNDFKSKILLFFYKLFGSNNNDLNKTKSSNSNISPNNSASNFQQYSILNSEKDIIQINPYDVANLFNRYLNKLPCPIITNEITSVLIQSITENDNLIHLTEFLKKNSNVSLSLNNLNDQSSAYSTDIQNLLDTISSIFLKELPKLNFHLLILMIDLFSGFNGDSRINQNDIYQSSRMNSYNISIIFQPCFFTNKHSFNTFDLSNFKKQSQPSQPSQSLVDNPNISIPQEKKKVSLKDLIDASNMDEFNYQKLILKLLIDNKSYFFNLIYKIYKSDINLQSKKLFIFIEYVLSNNNIPNNNIQNYRIHPSRIPPDYPEHPDSNNNQNNQNNQNNPNLPQLMGQINLETSSNQFNNHDQFQFEKQNINQNQNQFPTPTPTPIPIPILIPAQNQLTVDNQHLNTFQNHSPIHTPNQNQFPNLSPIQTQTSIQSPIQHSNYSSSLNDLISNQNQNQHQNQIYINYPCQNNSQHFIQNNSQTLTQSPNISQTFTQNSTQNSIQYPTQTQHHIQNPINVNAPNFAPSNPVPDLTHIGYPPQNDAPYLAQNSVQNSDHTPEQTPEQNLNPPAHPSAQEPIPPTIQ